MERPLTPGEIALVGEVFGTAVDPAPVRVCARKWAFFQPRHIVMAPRGNLHFHPAGDLYREDFATAPLGEQGLFIHEMTHVWQHQHGLNLPLRRHPFCRYSYSLKPGWPLKRYGIEQQAEIVRHAFLLSRGSSVAGAPGIERYRSILPFGR
jgi:hypothetical protein